MQSPDGQSEAPRAEQLPAQLAPSPQVANSIVLFWWQQLTVTESLRKVKALSKKSIEAAFVFPEVNYERKTIKVPKPGGVFVGTRLVLDDVSPDGHEAVSIGSPSQAAAEGALAQWRSLNFLQLDEEGSHVDHCPHSAHAPTTAADKRL